MARKKLSAIEYTVLGIAWKRGPCTTYALMKELASSTSTYYKARAGTAYPLVERLTAQGLLAQCGHAGAKGERLLEVTDAGIAVVQQWLSEAPDLTEVAHTVDFVRLRVFYMGLVTPHERVQFVDRTLVELRAHLASCEEAVGRYVAMGDEFSRMATMGVVAETQARVDWLSAIRPQLECAAIGKP